MNFKSLFTFIFLLLLNTLFSQETYKIGKTEYYYNSTYKTTGQPKVKRSQSARDEFLRSNGYNSVPNGYEVDHIQPLSKGGLDEIYNMQLLTKEADKQKTAIERNSQSNSTYYNNNHYNSNSTYNSLSNFDNYEITSSCGAQTKSGGYCKRIVKGGGYCSQHR